MVTIDKFYGTPWCSDCKRTKTYLGEQRIPFNWIDIDAEEESALFVESVNQGKRKVPTIVFSDGSVLVEPSNADLAAKLGISSELEHDFHDVLIVGGGPAGLTAGLYLARDGYDVAVIEKGSLGGQASYTEKLDNYPGFPDGIAGGDLAERIVRQCEKFGVEFQKATEVAGIRRQDNYLIVVCATGQEYACSAVVFATGSKYRKLGVPGEDDLIGYKLHFCSTCDGPFYKDKDVAVLGGGNSAFEEANFLSRFAKTVTIYGRSDNWKASKVLKDQAMKENNIFCVPNAEVKEVLVGKKKTLKGLLMKNPKTKETYEIHPDGVFLFIGLTPNAEPVKNLVEFDEGGFIKTAGNMMTSMDGLFSAGDCRSGSTKQAVSAMGEGAAVALHIRDYLKTL
ncbi:MAG: FAD-dependent oxidoreductase [Candidatus Heimdallarchaeota archaeon]|nr:FAD-dependent oxidoreductase [Candidatus Heimdallarchaeota archaeon]